MNRLIQIANNAKALNEKKILFEVYSDKDIQKFIIDLNRFGQLFRDGVQSDGTDLTSTNNTVGTYSLTTEILNRGKTFTANGLSKTKKAGDKYFLVDEGKFYESFKIKVNKDGSFTISASTIKPEVDMVKEYGDILGLTKPSLNELIKEILPFFIEETRKLLLK